MRKSLDDQKFDFKKLEGEVENLKKKQEAAAKMAAAAAQDANSLGGGGKTSAVQLQFND